MTLDTFFKKFDQFADAPDAVAKMRELVLRLAVQGKLSKRLSSDAPVSELYESLSRARHKEAKSRTSKSGIGESDSSKRPFATPSHWAWVPLNEIGRLSGGMTPSKTDASYWDGDVNWFSSRDIKSAELTESGLKITSKGLSATRLQLYPPGCLFMVARSGILKHTFPVSINRVEGAANQDLKVLMPFVSGLENYLQIMFRGMNEFIITSLVKTGMTVQSLVYEEFEKQPFPLPPLSEQKRIVAKVDELMALCDRLEAQQQERDEQANALARASLACFAEAPTLANLNLLFHKSYSIPSADLRKAILAMAIQGKIVPQVHDDKPAAKKIEPNGKLVTKVPFEIPRQWRWLHLSQLADINGGFAFKSHDYSERGTRVVRISDFDEVGFKNHKIVRHAFTPDLKKFTLDEGNILMAMTGGTVGKSYYVRSLPEPMIVNQRVATIKISPEVNPSYIDILIRSKMTQEVIRIAKNSTNDNISMGDIKGFAVPLPPLAEQRRIVAKVDQLMALVDQLETQLAASRSSATHLLEAVVSELTNQSSSGIQ